MKHVTLEMFERGESGKYITEPVYSQETIQKVLRTVPFVPVRAHINTVAHGLKRPRTKEDVPRYLEQCSELGIVPFLYVSVDTSGEMNVNFAYREDAFCDDPSKETIDFAFQRFMKGGKPHGLRFVIKSDERFKKFQEDRLEGLIKEGFQFESLDLWKTKTEAQEAYPFDTSNKHSGIEYSNGTLILELNYDEDSDEKVQNWFKSLK